MEEILTAINTNQGVIAASGLLLVLPLAIISDQVMNYYRKLGSRRDMRELLLQELLLNMRLVSQIEESYKENLQDELVHLPYFPPRTAVIDKFFEYELLTSLSKEEQRSLVETYGQLTELRREFLDWKTLLSKTGLKQEPDLYRRVSEVLLSYIDSAMQNMLQLWVVVVNKQGQHSKNDKISHLNRAIQILLAQEKWIVPYYKTSKYLALQEKPAVDVIICWEDDAVGQTGKEILEIRSVV